MGKEVLGRRLKDWRLVPTAADPATLPAGETRYSAITIDYHKNLAQAKDIKCYAWYVIGCPEDQQLTLKDTLGTYLHLTTEEQIRQTINENGFDITKWGK